MANQSATDIISLIEADHRKIEQLLEEVQHTRGAHKKFDVFMQIYKELNLHARGEELVFYPAMREFEQTEGYIEEAEEEHADAEVLLEEIKVMESANDPEFKDKMAELKEALMHHIEEEESEIFTAVRETMNDEQLLALGQEFQDAKGKVVEDIEAAMSK